jgi:recombination protein RecA
LLESGGFGLIVLDLGDLPPQSARRIPLTTWFRFRRAVENKPTILLAIEQHPIAGSCSSLLVQLGNQPAANSDNIGPTHAQLLTGMDITAELIRSRLDRKPARSVMFETKTAWAG